MDQSSLTGLEIGAVRFPGNKLPGYYHLVPSGRAGRKVTLAPMGFRRADEWRHAITFGKHHKNDKIPLFFDLASKIGSLAWVLPCDAGLVCRMLQARGRLADSFAR